MKSRVTRVVVLNPGEFRVRESLPMIDVLHIEEGELAGEEIIISWSLEDDLPIVVIEEMNRFGAKLRTMHQAGEIRFEVQKVRFKALEVQTK